MPDAKDNRKMSGDIRPPIDPAPFAPEELKQANLHADGTPADRGQASGGREGTDQPGREGSEPQGERGTSSRGDQGGG